MITGIYKTYDKKFAESPEVSKRFRLVLETIKKNLNDEAKSLFHKRTLFYALFAAIYEMLYGIGSTLSPTMARRLKNSDVVRVRTCGRAIVNKLAPSDVVAATTRRTSNIKERTRLANYLIRGI